MTLLELVTQSARQLEAAGLAFGHGTENAFDEAAWLVLWRLGLPLDTPLDYPHTDPIDAAHQLVGPVQQGDVAVLLDARIQTRKPAAYLTHEAWLMGVPFYVDERAIVPRSLIAELLFDESLDHWLGDDARRALDLCTGNGSLAVLAARVWPELAVHASDLSVDALAVARINLDKHGLQERITLLISDGLARVHGPYDLIICNPPYVNACSMAALPAEFKAEPALALDGNQAGGVDGMDFIRALLTQAPAQLTPQGVLVLEIGNERTHFEAAFPRLEPIWLATSAGEDQVLLLTREALLRPLASTARTGS
ncbi:MAG: 50S ribosomal protein L3 N(5)-glutamine methyltransferase [Burkholderiales bacterium]|nr:50S ribosomal protein L3 N(5)-glutamine methyltransferase [Burkholderiales bacterium]